MVELMRHQLTNRALVITVVLLLSFGLASCDTQEHRPAWLQTSPDGHHLVTPDGKPFVMQADSAWWLAERSTREDVVTYLDARRRQGYNTIMFAATLDFGKGRNAYGHTIWTGDASEPVPQFFDHVDFIIDQAQARGMQVAMAPAWVKHVTPPRGQGLTLQNANAFGRWIGQRYRDRRVIWIMGGDDSNWHEGIVRELALGVTHGVTGSDSTVGDEVVMTYHPGWAKSSSEKFHNESWLDFNMSQSGHCGRTLTSGHDLTTPDFDRWPVKPVIDGESFYEGHPLCMDPAQGYSNAQQVRNGWYNAVFGGGAGIAYGHHSVWQMYQPGRNGVNGPLRYWYDALDDEAAADAVHLRRLLESRPVLSLTPDGGTGTGAAGVRFTRADDGSYMMGYSTDGQPVTIDLSRLGGVDAQLWWYDPRTGDATDAGVLPSVGAVTRTPPLPQDWVLVADDADRRYPPPGQPYDGPTG